METRRICLDLTINSRPINKFDGKRIYVSTGDSDDMESGEVVGYYSRPSRANVQPKINDVIFAKMANTDKTFLIDEDLVKNIYSTGFFDVSSKRIYPKFLYYVIKSDEFNGYKNAYSEGTTQVSISDKRLRNIKITYETDVNKQKNIADFLDFRIGQIDKLILCLKNQITEITAIIDSLINEEIYHKHLREDCLYVNKDWLGKINKSWEIKKFKYLFTISKGLDITKSDLTLEGIPVISYGQTHNQKFLYNFSNNINDLPKVPETYLQFKKCIIKKGDFIFVDTSEDIKGSTDFSMHSTDDICLAGYHSLLAKPRSNIDSRFFMYQFRSSMWAHQIKARVEGVKVYSITQRILSNVEVVVPTIEEQKNIADTLDRLIAKYDYLIKIKNKKIDELENLKKSLIYEYVSGEKEVL
ncbi:MAG: restriction endonuclease subunit S [Candidatus Izemoplasmatales bacterium]|nr:restriction endonuclease subunit S [Candidatus Izemoplasmatales bacterium]MDD4070026.1 restriction endonuclease subunit S [Candidatus Izemoplasmatales bacterium]